MSENRLVILDAMGGRASCSFMTLLQVKGYRLKYKALMFELVISWQDVKLLKIIVQSKPWLEILDPRLHLKTYDWCGIKYDQ